MGLNMQGLRYMKFVTTTCVKTAYRLLEGHHEFPAEVHIFEHAL